MRLTSTPRGLATTPRGHAAVDQAERGKLASLDFDFLPSGFRADSSSPRISAVLVGCFAQKNVSLRNSQQNFRTKLRRQMSTSPGSRNSPVCSRRLPQRAGARTPNSSTPLQKMMPIRNPPFSLVFNDAICGCFEGILLEPCLLQPCFHVAGRREISQAEMEGFGP